MQDVLLGIQVFVVLNGMKFLKSSQSLARRITFSSCQFRRYFSTSPVIAQGDFSTPIIWRPFPINLINVDHHVPTAVSIV